MEPLWQRAMTLMLKVLQRNQPLLWHAAVSGTQRQRGHVCMQSARALLSAPYSRPFQALHTCRVLPARQVKCMLCWRPWPGRQRRFSVSMPLQRPTTSGEAVQ
jgi:hypothetical protein